jgi:hypothetical protein
MELCRHNTSKAERSKGVRLAFRKTCHRPITVQPNASRGWRIPVRPVKDVAHSIPSFPVLVPGRLRLATRPNPTGSLPVAKTMGMVGVAVFAASAATSELATITATRRWTRSAAPPAGGPDGALMTPEHHRARAAHLRKQGCLSFPSQID